MVVASGCLRRSSCPVLRRVPTSASTFWEGFSASLRLDPGRCRHACAQPLRLNQRSRLWISCGALWKPHSAAARRTAGSQRCANARDRSEAEKACGRIVAWRPSSLRTAFAHLTSQAGTEQNRTP